MFFKVIEIVLIVSFAVFVISQMIVPPFRGRPMFPLFRKQGKLEKEAAELKQAAFEKELEDKINQQREKQK